MHFHENIVDITEDLGLTRGKGTQNLGLNNFGNILKNSQKMK